MPLCLRQRTLPRAVRACTDHQNCCKQQHLNSDDAFGQSRHRFRLGSTAASHTNNCSSELRHTLRQHELQQSTPPLRRCIMRRLRLHQQRRCGIRPPRACSAVSSAPRPLSRPARHLRREVVTAPRPRRHHHTRRHTRRRRRGRTRHRRIRTRRPRGLL